MTQNSIEGKNCFEGGKNAKNQISVDNDLQQIIMRDKFLDLSKHLEDDISEVISKHMNHWRKENLNLINLNSFKSDYDSPNNLKSDKMKKTDVLPSRIFVSRNSFLTELFAISHIQSVYNIFAAILFILFLQEALNEFLKTGRVDLELSYMYWAFGKFDRALIIWLYMKSSTTLLVYLGFHYWAHNRHKLPGVYDAVATTIYFLYMITFLLLPVKDVLESGIGPASSIAVLCEQVRLLMKTWAFVWSNIGRAKNFKKTDDEQNESPCPDFSYYIYFLFAPTLVYRDEYPRNSSCNWRKVFIEFAQVIGCLFYIHFLFTTFCGPVFKKFGREEFSHTKLIKAGFSSCFPGFLILLCGFYMLLHSWMNAFAEMLRFADRMFYKDWWNSTSYRRFYRTWNCIVHDWLYEYVYKEISECQFRSKAWFRRLQFLPMLVVFFISAMVHEYILSFSFRFFYPVLLFMFGGFGVVFTFINTKGSLFNMFIWASLILGTGILMCLYSMEWYARINCDPVFDGLADYFAPRSWFCFRS